MCWVQDLVPVVPSFDDAFWSKLEETTGHPVPGYYPSQRMVNYNSLLCHTSNLEQKELNKYTVENNNATKGYV